METKKQKIPAALVHLYTGLGLPLALWAALAIADHDPRQFLIALWLAVFIDATDGFLARKLDVKRLLPGFDGRRLDDIIDYLTFVFLPSVGFAEFGILSENQTWIAAIPLLASAYGFCQERAKTEESFVGFPSYWNLVFLYLYILSPPQWLTIAVISGLSILVFVPVHYIYPSRTKWMRPVSIGLGCLYAPATAALCFFPSANWAENVAMVSLLYPIYYLLISGLHHRRISKTNSV